MANETQWNFVITRANDLFVPEFHGEILPFNKACLKAQGYANRTGETVYVWDLDESVKPDGKASKKITPVSVEIGSWCRVYVNQGIRDAQILGICDGFALIQYYMPKGLTALRTVDINHFDGTPYQKVEPTEKALSRKSLPKKWRDAGVRLK